MNDDYLWDKSGEPDPQIQQLEEILGTLRYQSKPLNLPRRRNYFPLLAIAATVVMALLTGGLWLQLQSPDASISPVAISQPTNPRINPPLSVANKPPAKRNVIVRNNRDRREREEALAAKQQLILALRVASEKLNTAYRRTQTPTQIKNQHKAG